MPKIKVKQNCSTTPNETFGKVQKFLETDSELRKIAPNLSFKFNNENLTGAASTSDFSADMNVAQAGAGSTVEIAIDLPFKFGLFKTKIQQVLEAKLKEYLA